MQVNSTKEMLLKLDIKGLNAKEVFTLTRCINWFVASGKAESDEKEFLFDLRKSLDQHRLDV